MSESSKQIGNRPEEWERFLTALDEKLQLGLLEHLRGVSSYHFEDDVLFIVPGTENAYDYLNEGSHFQQLEILAKAVLKVDKVKLRMPSKEEK